MAPQVERQQREPEARRFASRSPLLPRVHFDLLRVAGLARGLPLDSATREMEKLIEED